MTTTNHTGNTKQTTNARSVRAAQPLNSVQQPPPDQPAPTNPSLLPAPFPYPPEIEAKRKTYEQVAETFLDLYELQFDHHPPLTQIVSKAFTVDETDFVELVENHLRALFDEVHWPDRRTFMWLYPHLRMIVDAQQAERAADADAANQAA